MENIVSNTLISLSSTTTPLKKQRYAAIPRDEKSRTFSSNSQKGHKKSARSRF